MLNVSCPHRSPKTFTPRKKRRNPNGLRLVRSGFWTFRRDFHALKDSAFLFSAYWPWTECFSTRFFWRVKWELFLTYVFATFRKHSIHTSYEYIVKRFFFPFVCTTKTEGPNIQTNIWSFLHQFSPPYAFSQNNRKSSKKSRSRNLRNSSQVYEEMGDFPCKTLQLLTSKSLFRFRIHIFDFFKKVQKKLFNFNALEYYTVKFSML